MYHRTLSISVFTRDRRLGGMVRDLRPLEQFSHDVFLWDHWDPRLIADSRVVIWDLPGAARPSRVRAAAAPGALLVFCADRQDLDGYAAADLDAADEFWERPIHYGLTQRRLLRLLGQIKQACDLRLTEACLETSINNTPDMVWFKSTDGTHVRVNKAFCTMVGKSREDVTGQDHCTIWGVSRDDPNSGEAECRATEEAVIRAGRALQFTEHVKGPQGMRQLTTYKSPLYDWEGALLGTVGLGHDVTDITELRELQHKLEERTLLLNTALEEAKRANAAKSDFLSRMSHDIRTPMNAIAGMTEIADAHLDDPKRIRDCLQKIRLSSRHLLGLVNDVLDMSKIESGNFPLHVSQFSLREVVMITFAGVRERHQRFDVRLIHVEQEQFYCDALRLRQILLNLLSNAVKFTPGGGRISLDVEQLPMAQPQEAALRFTVSDSGPGMTPEFQEHLYEAFTRERDSRTDRIEGSGLGMAITKRLVDLLGGSITVRSTPGAGTRFQVTLPMRTAPRPPAEDPAFGVRVLLAGSDPDTLSCDEKMLRALGAQVSVASGCRQAAGMAEERALEDCSLVLLDCGSPCENVLRSVRRIRGASTNGRPKLVLSAYDWSDVQDGILAAGVDGFIEKPIFPSTLRECLRTYVLDEARPGRKPPSHDFSGRRFLLVEDNALNREIALELIGSFGAALEAAADGREAVERFAGSAPFTFDLILMDIQMPVMNGYEAARAIRALPRADAGAVPIIAMTADAFVEDIQNAKDAGMNGHMAKPLDFDTLADEIMRYLEAPRPGRG